MQSTAQPIKANKLLHALPSAELRMISPYLEFVHLPKGHLLSMRETAVEYCYFPTSGMASVVVQSPKNRACEVGLVGMEGFAPLAPALDAALTPFNTLMQIGGDGYRISVQDLRALIEQSGDLRRLLNNYVQFFFIQSAFTALSNANHSVEERLARWILMCQDRTGSDNLSLTHEFLSLMLAVRRPSITLALHELEGRRLVISKRGLIIVRDRVGLEGFAADSYGRPEEEYCTLIGEFRPSALLGAEEDQAMFASKAR